MDRPPSDPSEEAVLHYRCKVRSVVAPFEVEVPAWETDGHLPRSLFQTLGAEGLFRERWSAGARGGLRLAHALVQELAIVNFGAALAVSIHMELFIHALRLSRESELSALLDSALAGDCVGCFAATERTGGSDLGSLTCRAQAAPKGVRIVGSKCYVTNAGTATHALIVCQENPGRVGVQLVVSDLSGEGVMIDRYIPTTGVRSADTAELRFDQYVPGSNLLCTGNRALRTTFALLDFERLAAASALLAIARHAFTLSRAYLRARHQFGQRLMDHQALRHRLADRWVAIQSVDSHYQRVTDLAASGHVASGQIAGLKLSAAAMAQSTVDEAIQFFGARGYTEDFPLARMARDVRLTRIGGGTDEMMREIISRGLDRPDARGEELLAAYEGPAPGRPLPEGLQSA